jgi:hypothetical protein
MKEIILSPRCSGKTTFIENYNYKYEDNHLVCNEYLSSYNNIIKNIKIKGDSFVLPETHPLYKNWNDVYKIGIDIFYKENKKNLKLIFNGLNLINYIRNKYEEIPVKIVLIDELTHKKYWNKKIENTIFKQELTNLLKENSISLIDIYKYTWNYIMLERKEYNRLANIFNIKIYSSFEESLK